MFHYELFAAVLKLLDGLKGPVKIINKFRHVWAWLITPIQNREPQFPPLLYANNQIDQICSHKFQINTLHNKSCQTELFIVSEIFTPDILTTIWEIICERKNLRTERNIYVQTSQTSGFVQTLDKQISRQYLWIDSIFPEAKLKCDMFFPDRLAKKNIIFQT